jgi:hypothetical protein
VLFLVDDLLDLIQQASPSQVEVVTGQKALY